jgi:hypothetical protein
VLAKAELGSLEEDLAIRQKTVDLAKARAKLLEELAEMAQREQVMDADNDPAPSRRAMERFDGNGYFSEKQYALLSKAFEKQFGRALPVSAFGETELHRSLGYDHRGRVDIALNPDQPEGEWLTTYLKSARIPYYAFRKAIAGRATGAHIHLGPPSLRLRAAD